MAVETPACGWYTRPESGRWTSWVTLDKSISPWASPYPWGLSFLLCKMKEGSEITTPYMPRNSASLHLLHLFKPLLLCLLTICCILTSQH